MTHDPPSGDRSVNVGGNAIRTQITTGDHNVAVSITTDPRLPAAETVDVSAELTAIRSVLDALEGRDRKKIDNALREAEDDATGEDPDRDEVGKALDRAVEYASKTAGFLDVVDKMRPHLRNLAGWMGSYGPHVARVLGLDG